MKVIVFTSCNPFPVRSGVQFRTLQSLVAFRELGAKVHLTGAQRFLEMAWTPETCASLIDSGLCHAISVHRRSKSLFARVSSGISRRVRRILAEDALRDTTVDQTDLAMRRWFMRIKESEQADVVFIHYAWFAGLTAVQSRSAQPRTILEAHDLVTLHRAMSAKLEPHIRNGPVFQPSSVSEEALNLRFYDSSEVRAAPAEFQAIDRFDATLAIAEDEAAAIRTHVRHSRVFMVPTPVTPPKIRLPHGRFALFPMGAHAFNLQGYAWFVRKVLPRIVKVCPDFELAVSGITYYQVTLEYHPNVRILGFVTDTVDLWALGKMLLNPVFGGTGQPIKTIEAMAAGLPPVILARFAHAAPIIHGENGFIAHDEQEFADYCIALWRDPNLCWQMGSKAVEAVRTHCSQEKFTKQLQGILHDRGAPT